MSDSEVLIPDYTGWPRLAMVHGALRDETRQVVWECAHRHIGRETALECAEEELNRRRADPDAR